MVFRDAYPPSVRVPLEPAPERPDLVIPPEPDEAALAPDRPALLIRELPAPDLTI